MTASYEGSYPRFWRHDILTALGLSISAAVALGFSRFAYALLLPPMRDALDWTYLEAGSLNTANGAGYICGALATAWCAMRFGVVRCFTLGLLISSFILVLTAATSQFAFLLTLRTLGGFVTAFAFILGAALAGAITADRQTSHGSFLIGLYVAGASAGIVLSGATVPALLQDARFGWRAGWLVLGCLALLGFVPALIAARSLPMPATRTTATLRFHEMRQLAPTLVSYFCFGTGYVGFMTFVIALLRSHGGSSAESTGFWLVLGATSTVSTLLWGRVLGRLRGGQGPALVTIIAAFGTLPVLIFSGPVATFASALIFGCSFLVPPAAVTVVAKQQLPASSLTAGIALLTVCFAFGQAIGPLVAGAVSDFAHDVAAGLWVSPALLVVSALTSRLQRPVRDLT